MRILIVFPGDFPYGSAAANRILALSKALVRQGDKVKILLPFTYTLPKHDQSDNLYLGEISNVLYQYTIGRRFASKFIIRRLLDYYLLFYFNWLYHCIKLRKETDIIWLYGVNWFYILSARLLFKKVVCEYTEKPFMNKKVNNIVKFITYKCFKYVDGFLLISDPLISLFKNLAPYSLLKKIPTVAESFEGVPIYTTYKYMLHAGAISERKEGFVTQIKAFHKVISDLKINLKFVVLGDLKISPDFKEITKYIYENQLENDIIFCGIVDKPVVEKYMLGASVAVLHRYDNEQNRYGFSTKLAEYLIAKIPVITTPVGEVVKYFQDKKNIIFTLPGDVDKLAEQIKWCLLNTEKAHLIAKQGQKIAYEKFSPNSLSREIHEFFSNLM